MGEQSKPEQKVDAKVVAWILAVALTAVTAWFTQEVYSTTQSTGTAGLLAFYTGERYGLASWVTLPVALLMSPGNKWRPLIGYVLGLITIFPLVILVGVIVWVIPGLRYADLAVWMASLMSTAGAFFLFAWFAMSDVDPWAFFKHRSKQS